MNLLIRDELSAPPSWWPSFRDLTLWSETFLKLDVLLESNTPDDYYRWLKPKGGMDFIKEIVRPGSEGGIRLDVPHRPRQIILPRTVITARIDIGNTHKLIQEIASFTRN